MEAAAAVLSSARRKLSTLSTGGGTLPCLLVIASFTVVQLLLLMQSIIVPLLFAFFLTFVCDPMVNLLTQIPNERCCMRFCLTRSKARVLRERRLLDKPPDTYNSQSRRRSPPRSAPQSREVNVTVRSEDEAASKKEKLLTDSKMMFEADLLPRPCSWCLRTCRMPRCMAVFLTVITLIGIVVGCGVVIAHSIQSLNQNWESAYMPGINQFVAWINSVAQSLGYTLEDTSSFLMSAMESLAGDILTILIGFIETLVLVVIFLCYLLSSPVRPKEGVWLDIDRQIRKYVHWKTAISLLVGVCDGIILEVLRVDLAWIFAGITFIANYIPNIGSIVATLAPLPLAVLDSRIPVTEKILVVLCPFVLHNIIGNWIEPKVFGKQLELHPIVVLSALGFWSILWGVSGMILSVPLVAVFRIILIQVNHPYADIMVQLLEGRLFGKYDHLKDALTQEEKEDIQAEVSREASRIRVREDGGRGSLSHGEAPHGRRNSFLGGLQKGHSTDNLPAIIETTTPREQTPVTCREV